ncbi:hypothetical protein E4U13_005568, partial [Claviceps humidiphila]
MSSMDLHSLDNWTEQEIGALMELKGRGLSWRNVAAGIPGRSLKICQGRYARLLADEELRCNLAASYG